MDRTIRVYRFKKKEYLSIPQLVGYLDVDSATIYRILFEFKRNLPQFKFKSDRKKRYYFSLEEADKVRKKIKYSEKYFPSFFEGHKDNICQILRDHLKENIDEVVYDDEFNLYKNKLAEKMCKDYNRILTLKEYKKEIKKILER